MEITHTGIYKDTLDLLRKVSAIRRQKMVVVLDEALHTLVESDPVTRDLIEESLFNEVDRDREGLLQGRSS